ncbi:hypothetical protein ASD99_14865 [Mesorhizobium sp. Root695]|uniref:hypothetical protein n=1 Tax=Mesorhizobium sp. Root695 TaxID=1736589 RepID=UPI00070F5061|nr:hypothetical protein [Mesorhizobium sp. Root695]KRB13949.1 hypothetical protein ASD99_14865 [Mesorhizobium sp. Root695]
MDNADELARLFIQADGARARLDALLRQREAAQEGCGLSPRPAEIDKARDMAETAERLLNAHARMVRTA